MEGKHQFSDVLPTFQKFYKVGGKAKPLINICVGATLVGPASFQDAAEEFLGVANSPRAWLVGEHSALIRSPCHGNDQFMLLGKFGSKSNDVAHTTGSVQ